MLSSSLGWAPGRGIARPNGDSGLNGQRCCLLSPTACSSDFPVSTGSRISASSLTCSRVSLILAAPVGVEWIALHGCFFNIYLLYLTLPDLSCAMQDLQVQHVGSSSLTRD